MGQKNFAHGHAAFIIGISLIVLGVIIYLIESNSVFGNTWIAWVLIIIGGIELMIGGAAFGAHASSDKKEEPAAEPAVTPEKTAPEKTEEL